MLLLRPAVAAVVCHGLGWLGSACEVSLPHTLLPHTDLLWNSRHHSYVRVVTAYGGNQPNNLSGTRDFYFASTMDSSLERELSHPAKTTMTLSSILG